MAVCLKWLPVALAVLWLTAPCRAEAQAAPPPAPDPTAFFNKAVTSYEAGDFQQSIESVKKVFALTAAATPDMTVTEVAQLNAKLEAMYFTLGAAYFSLKQWPEATAALTDYVNRYPHGSRVLEARFTVAQASFFAADYEAAAKGFASMENVAAYREQALLFEGLSYKEAGKNSEGIAALELPSGGGHDCATFSGAGIPSAMIFVRNDRGSHNPDEAMDLEDFAQAMRLLMAFVDEVAFA